MKSKLIVLQIFLLSSLYSYGQQNYKVLYTDGNVFVNDSLITKGELIKDSEKIIFKNKKGVLKVCFDNCSKIKILSNYLFLKSKSKTISDYITYYESLGIRGNEVIKISELKDLLDISKVAVIDTLKISINNFNLPLDNSNYFYLRYNYLGDTINKKLETNNSELLINKDAFNIKNIGMIDTENCLLSLYHYNEIKKKSTLIISNFRIVFIDVQKIKNDIADIVKINNKSISFDEKLQFLSDYFKVDFPNTYINQNDLIGLLE